MCNNNIKQVQQYYDLNYFDYNYVVLCTSIYLLLDMNGLQWIIDKINHHGQSAMPNIQSIQILKTIHVTHEAREQ